MRIHYLLVLIATCAVACTTGSVPTGSRILPSYFRFKTIVEVDDDPKGSGWRAVCLVATMSQGMAGGTPLSSSTVCQAEFGTPIINRYGPVPLTRAQRVSANVANDVAYDVLTTSAPVTGLMCLQFIRQADDMPGRLTTWLGCGKERRHWVAMVIPWSCTTEGPWPRVVPTTSTTSCR